jgi:hypothetical protein
MNLARRSRSLFGIVGNSLITLYYRILHMPVNIDDFESNPVNALEITEGTQPHTILTFLASNSEQAFTQTEIYDATGIPRSSVGVVLSRLEARGVVRHRGRYWAIADDERLASLAAQEAASSVSTTDDYYGDTEE